MALLVLGAFLSVRQAGLALGIQRDVERARRQRAELQSEILELRHALAQRTQFASIEPRVHGAGMHAVASGQVQNLLPADPALLAQAAPRPPAARLLSAVLDVLGPAPAEARGRAAPWRRAQPLGPRSWEVR